ncbi:MAG: NAD-dependent epimerase/dehydratase family protein [Maricaulaceae bacterium]
MRIFLTGCAGFVGFHAAKKLLREGHYVIGVDNLNDYYDPSLKHTRLKVLHAYDDFEFHPVDIVDQAALQRVADGQGITHILHLAAQPGVRYSLENPRSYADSNLIGHLNILELARHTDGLEHLVYASSSSVYGDREGGDFREDDATRSPVSLYAATKMGGEMLAESYARLYDIAMTGLRFFTVYGPYGRPDMAYYMFIDKVLRGETITLFSPDEMERDFTYIDDITAVIPTLLEQMPQLTEGRRHEIYNLGNSSPAKLRDLVVAVETACGVKANIEVADKQAGDVSRTFANIDKARKKLQFDPQMPLGQGIQICVDWYRSYLS